MDDMLNNEALVYCRELTDRGGVNVVALAMGAECSFTDYMIICTATSQTHMRGLAKVISDMSRDMEREIRQPIKKSSEEEWLLLDGDDILFHFMMKDAREFYALEERWFESEVIYP